MTPLTTAITIATIPAMSARLGPFGAERGGGVTREALPP